MKYTLITHSIILVALLHMVVQGNSRGKIPESLRVKWTHRLESQNLAIGDQENTEGGLAKDWIEWKKAHTNELHETIDYLKNKMIKGERLFLKLTASSKIAEFESEYEYWRSAQSQCKGFKMVEQKDPKCNEGSITMCRQLDLLCKSIGKAQENPQNMMLFMQQKLDKMTEVAQKSGMVTFNAEDRARYELYTSIDTMNIVQAMKNYLETAGKVLAKTDYEKEAKNLQTYYDIFKKKESKQLKSYYEDYSKPMPFVMTLIIGVSGIAILLLIIRYFVFGLEKIQTNDHLQ